MDAGPTQIGPLNHEPLLFFAGFALLVWQLFFILEGADPGRVVSGKICVANSILVHRDKITQRPKQRIPVLDAETLHRETLDFVRFPLRLTAPLIF